MAMTSGAVMAAAAIASLAHQVNSTEEAKRGAAAEGARAQEDSDIAEGQLKQQEGVSEEMRKQAQLRARQKGIAGKRIDPANALYPSATTSAAAPTASVLGTGTGKSVLGS